MDIWVIYDSPKDCLGFYVARRHRVENGTTFPTDDMIQDVRLDWLRRKLPDGLVRFERSPEDDPRIVEVWL